MSSEVIFSLDHQFQYLDKLPESLYQKVVTLHYGSLKERVSGILIWRNHLLNAQLPKPESLSWPEEEIKIIVLRRIDGLDIIDDCKDQENLVDQLLLAVCDAIESIARRKEQGIHGLFDNILDRPFKKRQLKNNIEPEKSDSPDADSPSGSNNSSQTEKTPKQIKSNDALQFNSNFSPAELGTFKSQLTHNLNQITDTWFEIKHLFESMGTKPGRGWDLSHGRLQKQDWRDIVYFRRRIKAYPQLMPIVENLGRAHKKTKGKNAYEKNKINDHERISFLAHQKQTSTPMKIQGVSRSDDISRMLPSEAALLGHPKLKMLWHAKRAEQTLLSYQVEGVLSTHIPVALQKTGATLKNQKSDKGNEIQGPIIMCIDTSGSMKGEPELVSKAICLEVIRLATQENRACYLFIFSGPNEILELNLTLSLAGLRQIITFLQNTFHGGTNVIDVIEKACRKITQKDWKKADILLVSDGLFRIDPAFEKRISNIKKKYNLRIHGLLVGGLHTDGMKSICHPLHNFDTWKVTK